MSLSTLNKKEKKIRGRKTANKRFEITEDELKNSIIEFENMPPEVKAPIYQRGSLLLDNIIDKIEEVVRRMDEGRLNKANISSLGTTLKSLVQAYHFLELHFQHDSGNKMQNIPKDPEKLLEQTSEIVFRTKRRWDKG